MNTPNQFIEQTHRIERYKKGSASKRAKIEKGLFASGKWKVTRVEEVRRWNLWKTLILLVIFPPLALFGRTRYIEVHYERING